MDSPSTSASSYELRSRVLRSLSIDSHIQDWAVCNDELIVNEGPDQGAVVRRYQSKGKLLKSPVPPRPLPSRSPSRDGSHRSVSPSQARSRSRTRSRSPNLVRRILVRGF
jgi:hypothetical protein